MIEALTDVSGLERLREMLEIVGRIRLEVAAMERDLDNLYSWSRTCPQCGRFLERNDPKQSMTCPCGWVWE